MDPLGHFKEASRIGMKVPLSSARLQAEIARLLKKLVSMGQWSGSYSPKGGSSNECRQESTRGYDIQTGFALGKTIGG